MYIGANCNELLHDKSNNAKVFCQPGVGWARQTEIQFVHLEYINIYGLKLLFTRVCLVLEWINSVPKRRILLESVAD